MQPAKRRRSDAAPTPQSIAASNATSRLMLGCHGAQRSWMNHISSPDAHVANTAPTRPQPSPRRAQPQVLQPILTSTSLPPQSHTTTTPASAQTHTSPPAQPTLPTHSAQSPTDEPSPVEPIRTVNALRGKVPGRNLIRTVNGLRDESHTLKRPHQQEEQQDSDHEPRPAAGTIPTPSTTYSRSHSHTTVPANEAARPSPRLATMDSQSLPSPAPSDEYDPKSPRPSALDVNAAPGRAETPLHMFRQGRLRPSNPSQTNIRNTVQTNVPSPSTTALPSPSPITSVSPHSNVRPSPAATANARSSAETMPRHIQTAPSPRNGASLYSPDTGYSNPSPLQNLNVAPLHTHVQSDTPRLQNTWAVFAPAFCLPRIDNFRAHNHTQLGRSDGYRVTLLRQAIEAQDYFYLLLSALSSRNLLGQPLAIPGQQIPSTALSIVDQMLNADTQSSLLVLHFLASFPEPLEALSQHVGINNFIKQVGDVVSCLRALHLSWGTMLRDCGNRGDLPLTENLDRYLNITSPVLQRVAFRAMVSRLWQGWSPATERAVEDFRVEQDNFFKHGKPSGDAAEAQHLRYQTFYLQHTQYLAKAPPAILPTQTQPPHPAMQPGLTPVAQNNAGHYHVSPATTLPGPIQPTQVRNTARYNTLRQPQFVPQAQPQPQHYAQPQDALHPPSNRAGVPRRPHLFIPARGVIAPQPAVPDSSQSALHQAHLRSPVLRGQAVDGSPSTEKFYRYATGLVLGPQKLQAKPIQKLRFSISGDHMRRLPKGDPSKQDVLSSMIDTSTLFYRFRCCKVSPAGNLPEEKDWILQDGDWPESVYFVLNSKHLEVRRKLHHGKCLPIDLNPFLATENDLTVYLNRPSTDTSPFNYAVAVELVRIATKDSIKDHCLSKRIISSSDIRQSIMNSLSSTGSDGDDELAVVHSNLTIGLFEPFSASKIFDIPVRGASCVHRQAFDLDMFLDTRPFVSESAASKVDIWKCPFCGGDACPQSLVVDGFLMDVRKELESRTLLGTRAIIFMEDGTWVPKIEKDDPGEDDASDNEARNVAAIRRPIEIISLD